MADVVSTLLLPRRNEIRDRWLRDYSIQNPDAEIGEGSEPWNRACAYADSEIINYANAATIARSISIRGARGDALREKLQEAGTDFLPATGASGFVKIAAASTGTTIVQDDEIKINGKRYAAVRTDLYADKAEVAIVGIDTGPGTDQPPGTSGKWSHPRPGCSPNATVAAQADGSGLTGGHDAETDEEAQERLIRRRAEPPASGNDADYQEWGAKCPGVPVEQIFTYPSIVAPGTMALCFTLRPTSEGGNRIPNALQIALMRAHMQDRFGVNDPLFVLEIVPYPVIPVFRVKWTPGAAWWADTNLFPLYASGPVQISAVTSASAFVVDSTQQPQVGQSIGVYDAANKKFRRKVIATVGGSSGAWSLTFSTTGVSDAAFTPAVGDAVSPWSDSLDALVPNIRKHFDGVGPGEQIDAPDLFDPGLRQRRSPSPDIAFPDSISFDTLKDLFDVPACRLNISLTDLQTDAAFATTQTIPFKTPAGNITVSSKMITLGGIAVYPL